MEALGINLGMLVVQILVFIIVMLTLNAWVYKPMLNMMETRKQKIAQGLEDARVAAEARADAQKEADKIRAEAQAGAAHWIMSTAHGTRSRGVTPGSRARMQATDTGHARPVRHGNPNDVPCWPRSNHAGPRASQCRDAPQKQCPAH